VQGLLRTKREKEEWTTSIFFNATCAKELIRRSSVARRRHQRTPASFTVEVTEGGHHVRESSGGGEGKEAARRFKAVTWSQFFQSKLARVRIRDP